jgi:hypothetical protein
MPKPSPAVKRLAASEAELAWKYLQIKQLRETLAQAELSQPRAPRRARRKHLSASINLQRVTSPTR